MEKRLLNKVMGLVKGVLPFYLFTLLPLTAIAGNVKSPNGNIEVKFSVDNTGRPVYEMTYKGKAVVKPSDGIERERPDGRLCHREGRDFDL